MKGEVTHDDVRPGSLEDSGHINPRLICNGGLTNVKVVTTAKSVTHDIKLKPAELVIRVCKSITTTFSLD